MSLRLRTFALLMLVLGGSEAWAQGVSPFAEVLYWHASEETSSIWSSVISQSTSDPGNPTTTFAASDVQFGWNAGLRTGFLVEPEAWLWDFQLSWTHFRTAADAAVPAGQHLVLPEFFSGFLSGDAYFFTSAALDWHLAYDTIDLEAGHQFAIGESLVLRPTFGLKIATINQTIQAQWADPLLDLVANEHIDHDFLGVGPSFGLGATWALPQYPELRLVGSFSGAFLYGMWNVDDTFERANPEVELLSFQTFKTSLHDSTLGTVMLRYFVGCEWTRRGKADVTLHLGYELQWWANQQRLTTFQQLPMHGDLTLQGGTCGISVCF